MNEEQNLSPIERYLNHLDEIFQVKPIFFGGGTDDMGLPNAAVIVYNDIPEKGYITAFTYGLSIVDHPEWKFGRPELCISVKSDNENWAAIAGFLVNNMRGKFAFLYGQTINFGDKISQDSEMDAFFIFTPSTIAQEDYLYIDIGAEYKINIAGLYPIYAEEIEMFQKIGLEKFWQHPDYDNYAVNRKRILVDNSEN
jgi:hypothetical protein